MVRSKEAKSQEIYFRHNCWHASSKVNRDTLYSWLGMAVRGKDFKELAKEGVIKSVPSGSGRRKLWVRNGKKPTFTVGTVGNAV